MAALKKNNPNTSSQKTGSGIVGKATKAVVPGVSKKKQSNRLRIRGGNTATTPKSATLATLAPAGKTAASRGVNRIKSGIKAVSSFTNPVTGTRELVRIVRDIGPIDMLVLGAAFVVDAMFLVLVWETALGVFMDRLQEYDYMLFGMFIGLLAWHSSDNELSFTATIGLPLLFSFSLSMESMPVVQLLPFWTITAILYVFAHVAGKATKARASF